MFLCIFRNYLKKMDSNLLEDFIKRALVEDVGDGDHTSEACIPGNITGKAVLITRQAGVLAGVQVALTVLEMVGKEMRADVFINDGDTISPGDRIFEIQGPARSILKAERLILNIMQRMSGIATQTSLFIERVKGTGSKILDTRKTTPNVRFLEKEAVRIGGGFNHRMGLYDMILIKDNHIDYAGGVRNAIANTHKYLSETSRNLKIEVEARDFVELESILEIGGIHRILLDNFTPGETRKAVEMVSGRFETEASGGITLDTIRDYAESGVDYISVGALTHQILSLDMSLKAIKDE
jgi:nicotinate-nucleotide pyrophosphorylase (carboxylating)